MALDVWVTLQPGKPKKLHFTSWAKIPRVITDPITGMPKQINTLVLGVDEEDGVRVAKQFSVISQKLAAELEPWLTSHTFQNYNFVIVKDLAGPVPPKVLAVEPRGR